MEWNLIIKGVMAQSIVDALLKLCSPSGLFVYGRLQNLKASEDTFGHDIPYKLGKVCTHSP